MASIIFDFADIGVTPEFTHADIVNRAVDAALSLCFPEFEESQVINVDKIHVSFIGGAVLVPIILKIKTEEF